MDSHPTCRHPHKKPAHTVKELGELASAPIPCRVNFRRCEPPIIADFLLSSTPHFEEVAIAAWLVTEVLYRSEPPIMTGFSALSTTCEIRSGDRRSSSCRRGPGPKTEGLQKKENPADVSAGFSGINPGDDLLSHSLGCTTIGASAFHFRVRDGIGWFHSANFTRETVGASPAFEMNAQGSYSLGIRVKSA
jgi:hypothetical protein